MASNLTQARFVTGPYGGQAVAFGYDALVRVTGTTSTMGGTARTITYAYDPTGRREAMWYQSRLSEAPA